MILEVHMTDLSPQDFEMVRFVTHIIQLAKFQQIFVRASGRTYQGRAKGTSYFLSRGISASQGTRFQ